MKVVVCAKQVPNTNEVKIDPVKGTLIRDGVESILNPDDANALEEALKLKDEYEDVTVTVISMGPPQAEVMLRECLAMGADEAILLSGREFGGSDTWATSNAISAAIEKIGDYDIIFGGRQAIDGDTAQVGPQIAEKLNLPQVTYVADMKKDGNVLTVKRLLEDGYMTIQVQTPCLLTCVREMNAPRYMTIKNILGCYQKPVRILDYNALKDDPLIDLTTIGLKGSPTNIFRSFTPPKKEAGRILAGTEEEAVEELVSQLVKKHVI